MTTRQDYNCPPSETSNEDVKLNETMNSVEIELEERVRK